MDGLYDAQILELLRPPHPPATDASLAKTLVETAVERGGRDNTTAIVVEVR